MERCHLSGNMYLDNIHSGGDGDGLVAKLCPTLCDPMDCSLHQALLTMEFSRQENWSGLPCPPPWDLPDPGIEPRSPALQMDSLLSEPPGLVLLVNCLYTCSAIS